MIILLVPMVRLVLHHIRLCDLMCLQVQVEIQALLVFMFSAVVVRVAAMLG